MAQNHHIPRGGKSEANIVRQYHQNAISPKHRRNPKKILMSSLTLRPIPLSRSGSKIPLHIRGIKWDTRHPPNILRDFFKSLKLLL
jgi:hypothetical protein